MHEEDPYLGFILNTKRILSNFRENFVVKGLLGDLSLMHRSRPGLGRDNKDENNVSLLSSLVVPTSTFFPLSFIFSYGLSPSLFLSLFSLLPTLTNGQLIYLLLSLSLSSVPVISRIHIFIYRQQLKCFIVEKLDEGVVKFLLLPFFSIWLYGYHIWLKFPQLLWLYGQSAYFVRWLLLVFNFSFKPYSTVRILSTCLIIIIIIIFFSILIIM